MAKTQKTQSQKPATVPAVKAEKQTREDLFAKSISRIKSTGNANLDAAMQRILYKIHSGEAVITPVEDGFATVIGAAKVQIVKKAVKKANRCSMNIGGMDVGGGFAAKAFALCQRALRPAKTPGVKAAKFDEALVASILEQLTA